MLQFIAQIFIFLFQFLHLLFNIAHIPLHGGKGAKLAAKGKRQVH
ncbi:MAG: hypothetical protein A4E52_02141 [Pelotomaculum sp. PtaB.Bin013]|nr:MAG: hypothetical protein A4E52_02141 [Pelotomaculum sp. PtaB.Bin013]